MKCSILYVVGQLRSGGSERQLFYLLQSLDRSRYQLAVAVWNFCEDDPYVQAIRKLDVPLYPCSPKPSRIAKFVSFLRIVKRLQPEIIHSYSFFLNVVAYYASRSIGAISIGSVRGDFINDSLDSGWLLGRLSARWPCAQIYNSHTAAKNAQDSKGIFVPKRIFVVRNALDLKQFVGLFNPVVSEAIMLGVGSLYSVKRWDRLLLAAAELKRRGKEYRIQIAGDGPLLRILQEKAKELDITSCVEFLGHRRDIAALLSQVRFLVHTGDHEGCPNVIMEAMACGRPVVAVNAGDIPYLVDDGKTGFVVGRGDIEALVDRISQLLTNNDLCRRMGEAGRIKAELEFRLERFVAQTLEVYQAEGWRP